MDDEIDNIIKKIFPMKDADTVKLMLDVIMNDIDEGKKSKRLSLLRDIIGKAIE